MSTLGSLRDIELASIKKSGTNFLSKEESPKAKFLRIGPSSLTTSELLTILIGSGSTNCSPITIAQSIASYYDNDWVKISKMTVNDLKSIEGVGPAKAIAILSAVEIGKRIANASRTEKITKISSPELIYKVIRGDIEHKLTEEFWVILLSNSNRLIGKYCVSVGGIGSTVVDPRVIFKKVLEFSAPKFAVAHNHPSGVAKPSNNDLNITANLLHGSAILDLEMVDHIIVGDNSYYSFADNNLLKRV